MLGVRSMADQSWRGLLPGVSAVRHAEAEIVKLAHVDRIEGLRAGVDEVAGNVSEIVIHVVRLGEHIELVEVADPLALDQARYRAARNRQGPRLHRLVFRSDVAVANNVGSPDRADAEASIYLVRHKLGRHEKDLTRRPAVEHLFEGSIVFWTEGSEGRGERAGRNSRHH